MLHTSNKWKIRYDNNFDALNPELWARESLIQLFANSVMLSRINRQFDNVVADFGNTVHANRPGTFVMNRTGYTTDNTVQYATTEDIEVKLNQKYDVTMALRDTERAFAFKDLVAMHLVPAVQAIAGGLDTSLITQMYQFMGNTKSVGKLGTATTYDNVVDLSVLMDDNLIPADNRHVVVPPAMYGSVAKVENFVVMDKIGTANALKTGELGMLYGLNFAKANNAPSIKSDYVDSEAMALNGAHTAGDTTLTLSADPTSKAPTGKWCTVAGDMQPHRITAFDSDEITISPGLKYDCLTGAVVTIYKGVTVNLSAGYDIGEVGTIAYDGTTAATAKVQHGQLVSDGTLYYGCINSPAHNGVIQLDRPLEGALTNDDLLGYTPVGNYGFAFHPNALTFVSRPLPLPPARFVDSSVVSWNGIGIRVTISYDNLKNLTYVKLDLLGGIKVLDSRLGCVLYG